ncbi:MAG: Snf7 family protein, partial [Promethearchaeota archaeon]
VQEKFARKRAIEKRQAGDIKGSKLHMKNSLQYRKWANSTDKFRLKIEGVQYRLEQAKVMGQFSDCAKDIVGAMQGLELNVKLPAIQKMMGEMDLGFGNMEAIMEETSQQLETGEAAGKAGVSDKEVEEALSQIDQEASIESAMALPSIPNVEEPEAQLDSLEEEIKKLKESRKS